MTIKTIIFDFDGVLADSFKHVYALNKDSMAEVGIKLSEEQYRKFFVGNIHSGFREFIKDDALFEKFSELRQQNFGKYYSAVKLFPETAEFINKIKRKFILAVASSGERNWIVKLLNDGHLYQHFHLISAGKDKKEKMINSIAKSLKCNFQKMIFISDTCGDLTLAKKLGLKTVGVSWGFHSPKTLHSAKSDFLAEDFNELISYLCHR